jgi:hypothetical protein
MITLTFDDAKFNAEFSRKIVAARNPLTILRGAGREVVNQLRSHFDRKDHDEPNKLSERRSHFWLAVRDSVQNPEVSGNTVTVTINHPDFAQKVFGGKIEAKEAGALTIPEEERAYGRSTRTFEAETGLTLFLIKTGKGAFGNAVLAVKDNNAKGFTVEYLLTKSVNQKADTDALPDKSVLETAILRRSQRTLDRQMASDNPGSIDPETV